MGIWIDYATWDEEVMLGNAHMSRHLFQNDATVIDG